MARAPMMAPTDPAADDDASAGAPDAGAAPLDTDDAAGDQSDNVLVTIASDPNGGFLVYAGDEPEGDEGASDDDAAAGGAAGAAPGASGQHVDTVGAALKAALDILNEAGNSAGEPGSSEDQFQLGFGADQSPTPAAKRLKHPPAVAA